MWRGISAFTVIGAYFFEQNHQAVTVTAERNGTMLEAFLVEELYRRRKNSAWFQQEEATHKDRVWQH